MRKSVRKNLACSTVTAAVLAACGLGCAGVKNNSTGSGGSGGSNLPAIPGLRSLAVTPPEQTVDLQEMNGMIVPATAMYTATGTFDDGSSRDVTNMVSWPTNLSSLLVSGGNAMVSAPGTYIITAQSGSVTATARLIARFTGSFVNVPDTARTSLDGTPSGAASIAYPLDGALFPKNLGPIFVHITKNSGATAARLRFEGDGLDVMWYGPCESDTRNLPGPGCYVKLPLQLTQLFIASSENADITLTARVGGSGAPAESGSIKVAWSNVALTGGLYFWTTIDPTSQIAIGYTPADVPPPGSPNVGTGVERYNFDKDMPVPELVWTDRGAPPAFAGAPQSFVGSVAGSHCIGCHAITNDGKYMALTIGGSSSTDGANWSVLDITAKALAIINPTAKTDPNSSPTSNPTDYFKQFRKDGLATETTWGPNGDLMVNMFQSKLYLASVTVTSPTGTVARQGFALPSYGEYQSDPFWSQDGKFLAFTSFATPDMGLYNTTGLNGDEKQGGQIAIASAEATAIHDDAHVIVPRQGGVTSFYPAISNDSKLLVYNQAACGPAVDMNKSTTDYGNQSCDGYDDWTSTLWLTSPDGKAPARLDHANGTAPASNSWPRWSPDNGVFRGKRLYWIAFSSRRAYGLQVNNGTAPTMSRPQLWFTGVVTGDEFGGDPSFAPVWLPGQNPNQAIPSGNHVPQWVKVAVVIPQ